MSNSPNPPLEQNPAPGIGRRDLLRQATVLAAGATAGSLAQAQPQPDGGPAYLFPDHFRNYRVQTSGATINLVKGGSGPPLLLLHGYPQSHVEWHRIAPQLARDYTVVAADLRGYGDSSKPPDGDNHAGHSKRATAQDQVEMMKHFGFDQFRVVGHDRGGRVAHRMALDHPETVTKVAVLDIVPTYKIFHNVTREFATAYYHWFFLIQRAPLPEKCIESNLELFVGRGSSTPEAHTDILRTFRIPGTIHAACEDYRAAASIDLEHDEADIAKKIACPLLALWAQEGPMNRLFDVLAAWRERASDVRGKVLPGGHFLPEGTPEQTLAELQTFLRT
jgi:haloacetate dehalogenase